MEEEEIRKIPELTFFYNLDDEEGLQSSDTDIYINKCSECIPKSSIIPYARNTIRNYFRYKEHMNSSSHSKYCRYLKYWLYRERYKFSVNNHMKSDSWDKCLPCVWKKLKDSHSNSGNICNWNNEKYPKAIINMRAYLDEFCSIKEYLNTKYTLVSDVDRCLYYNKKRNHYIKYILKYMASISGITEFIPSYFTIDENCSFSNFDKTFPEITCQSDCTTCNREPLVAKAEALCSSTESEPEPRTDVPDEIEDEHAISNCSSTGIFLSSTITLLITVLVFFILYRFSPFGSWLYNRLRKQNKSLKNLDDEINGNISEFPLKFIERNDENMRHYIVYEAQ
ncbi:PIR Superfamily Protein [Plasmodium ovale curtisi]|uniref:PIR Superfamily Protein n=1 Tax=Plasmodium ovale curtisi TaxID=864141 RepID=A0A1A8WHT2_PLAOA|nr:PIR Superfamily Protein [Plasmodium ovale curtisi]